MDKATAQENKAYALSIGLREYLGMPCRRCGSMNKKLFMHGGYMKSTCHDCKKAYHKSYNRKTGCYKGIFPNRRSPNAPIMHENLKIVGSPPRVCSLMAGFLKSSPISSSSSACN